MRLVVLGASGGCGRFLVEQGHAAGHEVVAVGRASSKLDYEGEVERGALDDAGFLAETFAGADVVLVGVGVVADPALVWASYRVVLRPVAVEDPYRAIVHAQRKADGNFSPRLDEHLSHVF